MAPLAYSVASVRLIHIQSLRLQVLEEGNKVSREEGSLAPFLFPLHRAYSHTDRAQPFRFPFSFACRLLYLFYVPYIFMTRQTRSHPSAKFACRLDERAFRYSCMCSHLLQARPQFLSWLGSHFTASQVRSRRLRPLFPRFLSLSLPQSLYPSIARVFISQLFSLAFARFRAHITPFLLGLFPFLSFLSFFLFSLF